MKQYILTFSLLCYSVFSESVSDFQGKSFKFTNKQSQIYKVNVGVEDEMDLGLMSAYGDFNGDKAVDVVMVGYQKNSIKILYWDNTINEFKKNDVCVDCYPTSNYIQGVIPVDYDYDGLLDILVVLDSDVGFSIHILKQAKEYDDDGYAKFAGIQEFYYSTSYPFVADFFGNHKSSFMITVDGVRKIIQYNQPETNFIDLVSFDNECFQKTVVEETLKQKFLTPHFNSFVDVSQDCRADLIITSEQGIEYWYTKYIAEKQTTEINPDEQQSQEPLQINQGRFCLLNIDKFPPNVQIKTLDFVDVNFDGAIDMIYIYEKDDKQNLLINYNKIENPISPPNLCQSNTKDSEKQQLYPFTDYHSAPSQTCSITPLQHNDQPIKLFDYTKFDLNAEFSLNKALAPFIRFGDYLASGFPGAFITIFNETQKQPNIFYLQNQPISENCQLESKMCRQLVINNDPGDHFYIITETQGINVAFFDYGENGRLDFLVNTISKNNEKDEFRFGLAAFYNYISLDAFFLKALGLNGQCGADEESKISCQGSLYYGSTYQFRVTDISGSYKPAAGVQLYQSAYTPLQLPYTYMGLGRTNNYIENFYLGVPLKNGQIRQWTPIIPNSQLIVSPYTDSTKSWTLSIFIEPTEAILVVVIVTIIILFVLGGIIIWKHIKEKEDDKKNQEQFFQMFR